MAIAIVSTSDTATAAIDMTSVLSLTWSHTVAAGSNKLLVVMLHTLVDGNVGASGVTFNGDAMTELRDEVAVSGGRDSGAEVWYLINPDVATGDIVVTLNTTMHVASATAVDFTGVDQSTPFEANEGSVDAGGDTVTDDITTLTDGALVIQCMSGVQAAAGVTQDSGQTEWTDNDTAGATDTLTWCDAYESIATAGLNSFATSGWAADDVCIILGAIKPASSAFNVKPTMFQVF